MEFYKIAYDFLRASKVSVSQKYLRERLESHSQYPSLVCLTDILDEFGIENHPLRINAPEKWKDLELPFLAHVVTKDGTTDFELIKTRSKSGPNVDFLKKWTGVVLMIGDEKKINHKEHNSQYKNERKQVKAIRLLLVMIVMFVLSTQLISGELFLLIHLMFSFIGLFFSCLIVAQSLGLNNNLTKLFCQVQESGCNAVLNSKLGKFGGTIGLGDLAVIYFFGSILYLTFSISFPIIERVTLMFLVNLLAFLFTPISIIYQLHLKSWCKLCLAILVVIWLQTVNLTWHIYDMKFYFLTFPRISLIVYLFFGLSMLLASFWIIIKPFKIEEKESLHQKIRIRKWKQDPSWFDALLPLHKKINDAVWVKEIYYGNPSGVLQIIVVSSPYCAFCAKAHSELEAILEKHPHDIGVRVRFTLKSYDRVNQDYKAVLNILGVYDEVVWKKNLDSNSKPMKSIISNWYKKQDLSDWSSAGYSFNQEVVDSLIRKSGRWASGMGVNQTPAFFINGHEMPNPHTFQDLFLFISEYIEILKNKKKLASNI